MPYFGRYLTNRGREMLHVYKYKGSDDSILLNYVTNPIYQRLVLLFPTWLAPNIITLCGVSFTILGHIMTYSHCPSLNGHIPAWLCFYNGFAIIMAQCLDALDGKQARRTGSGSPLGLLMDHGCDAINTTTMALTGAAAIQLGPSSMAMLLWIVHGVGFFAATWEEYYVGELHLGYINGPNEGLMSAALLHILTGFVGTDFWIQESMFGIPRGHVVVYLLLLAGVLTMISNFYYVITRIRKDRHRDPTAQSDAELESSSVKVAISRFLPLLTVISGFVLWVTYSPSDILARHPRVLLWTLGLVMSKQVTQIMLSHLCDEEHHPMSKTMAALFVIVAHAVAAVYMEVTSQSSDKLLSWHEDLILLEAFVLMLGSYTHMVFSVVQEVAETLGIYVFTITRKRTPLTSKRRKIKVESK
mmetsp:Transcript_10272/g.23412  ORF Transcript_10272/g.23412 Transcript_10272/m.23412 type:complete len:415 (+) Transcript_10272:42-1286(+)|eukprot:CAMPEP_0114561580 /NCGR_PEP_ID=MMETSP0114-20121206/12079_1 /TAXON_ID=31324 /ORGANISM="Goniomonas sp, Strain m" /LENGTH=414 /DNA_ID=CAMNT_0001747223 /DNA_START=20 /DNA_END=1264 /DNA_ORIENTATION=-